MKFNIKDWAILLFTIQSSFFLTIATLSQTQNADSDTVSGGRLLHDSAEATSSGSKVKLFSYHHVV